jgi:hypothetical protein
VDVLDALQTSAWPEACGTDVREHVEACPGCAELVEVVLPLIDEHRTVTRDACVPAAGSVWWRAQLRARREASDTATRPIVVLQGVSLACGAGLVAAGLGFLVFAFRRSAGWLATVVRAIDLPTVAWADIVSVGPVWMTVAVGVTLLMVLMPVAIYMAFSDE